MTGYHKVLIALEAYEAFTPTNEIEEQGWYDDVEAIIDQALEDDEITATEADNLRAYMGI